MNGSAKRNNKFNIIEKELIESKTLAQDLRTDAKQTCVEYDKLQNKCSCIELRHEDLVETLKFESFRAILCSKKKIISE